MPTYRQYIEQAASFAGEPYAAVWPIAGLAAQTLTVTKLGRGELAEKYAGTYINRLYAAAAADRERTVSSFANSTGVFTHAGTAYSDTTATGESVFWSALPMSWWDTALVRALEATPRLDVDMLPGYSGNRYPLTDLTWITRRSQVKKVSKRNSPVVTRNRHFDKWNTVNTSGVLQPDWWTLTGANATMARSTTGTTQPGNPYTVAITRVGTDCRIEQTVLSLATGISGDVSLAGKTVYAVAKVYATVASRSRVRLLVDGSVVASSSYHTGDSTVQELSTSFAVPSTASNVTIYVTVETGNTTVYVDEAYIVPDELSTTVRRDEYDEEELALNWEQGPPLMLRTGHALGSQILVRSERPYPAFDATRQAAGTADADSSDAPLGVIAAGICSYVFERAAIKQPKTYGQAAEYWAGQFERMRTDHLASVTDIPKTALQKQVGMARYQPVTQVWR